jgi:hypothetical protein
MTDEEVINLIDDIFNRIYDYYEKEIIYNVHSK